VGCTCSDRCSNIILVIYAVYFTGWQCPLYVGRCQIKNRICLLVMMECFADFLTPSEVRTDPHLITSDNQTPVCLMKVHVHCEVLLNVFTMCDYYKASKKLFRRIWVSNFLHRSSSVPEEDGFYGPYFFLSPNHQRQRTEGNT